MTPERWQKVRDVLHEAMQLKPEERHTYLDHWCADDDDLRQQISELLEAEEGLTTDFLESLPQAEAALNRLTVFAANKSAHATSKEPLVGRRVGSYRIVQRIGSGGMGEVYRAFRADDQYRKQVAVKVVRQGQNSSVVVERFKNERQILADLDHPNIARLHDGRDHRGGGSVLRDGTDRGSAHR
ncbi:MAG TPA: protein kinase [Candidatus Acidoferrum sp.]|nr:protein kinase [Candidatus Acidoferrum sp.]